MTEPILMAAKHPGTCGGCADSIKLNQQIAWYGKGEAYHADCRPVASRQPARQTKLIQAGYLFVDLETTGLYCDKHGIVQIAAIATSNSLVVQGTWSSLVKPAPHLEVEDAALELNGICREQIIAAPEEHTVANEFVAFCRKWADYRFAGYNCIFDLEFLAKLLTRTQVTGRVYLLPPFDVYRDVVKPHRAFDACENRKLSTVTKFLGINAAKAHDALVDLFLTIQVARKIEELD